MQHDPSPGRRVVDNSPSEGTRFCQSHQSRLEHPGVPDGTWSCCWCTFINKLHIVNHFCVVTIIGQCKPGQFITTRTTRFNEDMERLLPSLRGQFKLRHVIVCGEMTCEPTKDSVNCSSSGRCHIRTGGYTGRDPRKQHRTEWKNTLEQYGNATLQGNLNSNFFWVCGYNKLNTFNEGNFVFADVFWSNQTIFLSETVLLLPGDVNKNCKATHKAVTHACELINRVGMLCAFYNCYQLHGAARNSWQYICFLMCQHL